MKQALDNAEEVSRPGPTSRLLVPWVTAPRRKCLIRIPSKRKVRRSVPVSCPPEPHALDGAVDPGFVREEYIASRLSSGTDRLSALIHTCTCYTRKHAGKRWKSFKEERVLSLGVISNILPYWLATSLSLRITCTAFMSNHSPGRPLLRSSQASSKRPRNLIHLIPGNLSDPSQLRQGCKRVHWIAHSGYSLLPRPRCIGQVILEVAPSRRNSLRGSERVQLHDGSGETWSGLCSKLPSDRGDDLRPGTLCPNFSSTIWYPDRG
jgi:hypothetical protein